MKSAVIVAGGSSTRFEPIKPAAPVTSTVLFFKLIFGVSMFHL